MGCSTVVVVVEYYKIIENLQALESVGIRPAIRYAPKGGSEVIGIWRNMTVQDIANVLRKDLGEFS